MPNAQSPSIIQRLAHRAITGLALGITARQHFGFRMHFEWEGAFGVRCFDRRFPSYDSLSHFCVTWIKGTPEGLCTCTIVREGSREIGESEFARVLALTFT